MTGWEPTTTKSIGGRLRLIATRVGLYNPVDITFVRGVRTLVSEFSNADPFGDATMSLTFPAITGMDDWTSPELETWLADYTDIDLWWVPGYDSTAGLIMPPGETFPPFVNPLTERFDAISPDVSFELVGATYRPHDAGIKLWEGFIASFDSEGDEGDDTLQVSCQGALFQNDAYYAKPFYPPNPQTLESLILGSFDRTAKPHLRTNPAHIMFPPNWSKVAPTNDAYLYPNVYAPNVTPGTKWTGYSQRDTGSWQHALTGFIQSMLPVMITQNDSGVTPGNQWTLLQALQGDPDFPAGRTPVLQIRDRYRDPDVEYWIGQQGVTRSLTRDTTQTAKVVYGSGTNLDGTDWRQALVSPDGSRTDYAPLAASPDAYPTVGNPLFRPYEFIREVYNNYGPGFNQSDAVTSAARTLQRDRDAGWSGTLTVKVDPRQGMSRFQIRAGMTLRLKGFQGSGTTGVKFHIASVSCHPENGDVVLTVDTRYRDLLNVEESVARSRDPMTPSKLLQVGQSSYIIEDVQAQWDYRAGSGIMPTVGLNLYNYLPAGNSFPYQNWLKKNPPSRMPQYYVLCHADAVSTRARWAGPIPILMAEKGDIIRSEFFACDVQGNILALPFHISLYYVNVHADDMPFSGSNYSPFQPNAFTKINPSTGQPWPAGSFLTPQQSLIIGWGVGPQMAGYSPGQSSNAGALPTGELVDESTWHFDCTNNSVFDPNLRAGQTQPQGAVTIYAMIYANTLDSGSGTENPGAVARQPVYFGGRLFRQNPAN